MIFTTISRTSGYDVPLLSNKLDWISVMCYDYHGQWDEVTGHVAPMYVHPEDEDQTFNAVNLLFIKRREILTEH